MRHKHGKMGKGAAADRHSLSHFRQRIFCDNNDNFHCCVGGSGVNPAPLDHMRAEEGIPRAVGPARRCQDEGQRRRRRLH